MESIIETYDRDNSLPLNWLSIYKTCRYAKTVIDREVTNYIESLFGNLSFKITNVIKIEGGYVLSMDYDV